MPLKKKKRTAKKKSVKKASKKKLLKKKVIKKKGLPKRKKVTKKAPRKKAPKERKDIIGLVTHYFPKVRAAVVKLKAPLSIGDMVKIKGHTTDFTQNVTSIQIDHVPINSAKKGQEIGLLVDSRVRRNDAVYKT